MTERMSNPASGPAPDARCSHVCCILDHCRLTHRLLGRPYISMDTFSKYSTYCKVNIMCHLARNALKN